MGKVLAGDSESYQYLVESIEKFPSQIEFAQLSVHPTTDDLLLLMGRTGFVKLDSRMDR